MPRVFDAGNSAETPEPLSVDDFFGAVCSLREPQFSDDYIERCAALLVRLNSNPDLIWSHLEKCGNAARWIESFTAPQSFILGATRAIALRANIWLPPQQSVFESHSRDLYAYELAHNHDFRFLTIGHWGPGYLTDIFEIDPDVVQGCLGEEITIGNIIHEQLTPGKVLYFEPYRDVHVQHEPTSLSISINLLFTGEERIRDQLFFDVAQSRVAAQPPDAIVNRRIAAMRLAALTRNDKALSTIKDIRENTLNSRLRAGADLALRMQDNG